MKPNKGNEIHRSVRDSVLVGVRDSVLVGVWDRVLDRVLDRVWDRVRVNEQLKKEYPE